MKPGYLTTEFWIAVAIVLLGAVAQVWPGNDMAQLAGLIAAGMASAGYGFARAGAKKAAAGIVEREIEEEHWTARKTLEAAKAGVDVEALMEDEG